MHPRPCEPIRWGRALLGLLLLALPLRAHESATVADLTAAATHLLAALGPEQRALAVFSWEDAQRLDWHYIPRTRRGLPLRDMTPAQRHLAGALLHTTMSQRGLLKVDTIMSLEDVLRDLEKGQGPVRDPELYFVSIFGEPGGTQPWGWRWEGHHLSLNFTVVDGEQVTTAPSFLGSNPGDVRSGPRKGLRVLGAEEDLGRALIRSLTDEQRRVAVFRTNAPADIFLSPDRKAGALEPLGLSAARMNPAQQKRLRALLAEYVHRFRPELAANDLKQIEAGWPTHVHFAWAGGIEPGMGHYYRVQGPSFILEYDNTQNDANHIHTVWRDFRNDFGADLLRQHYATTPHGH